MAGGVDQIKDIGFAVFGVIRHGDGVRFDGDAAFALQIHAVQQLILHVAERDGAGLFQNAVGQSGFAVVDVRDDAKIAGMVTGYAQCQHLSDSEYQQYSIFYREAQEKARGFGRRTENG